MDTCSLVGEIRRLKTLQGKGGWGGPLEIIGTTTLPTLEPVRGLAT